ncbi:hypothetical protein EDB86DRAFT_987929 [Lactarius hatsudake]|nr:hypothetical protein EDB86DRAFT_987929 [Lactarius hatsudake]
MKSRFLHSTTTLVVFFVIGCDSKRKRVEWCVGLLSRPRPSYTIPVCPSKISVSIMSGVGEKRYRHWHTPTDWTHVGTGYHVSDPYRLLHHVPATSRHWQVTVRHKSVPRSLTGELAEIPRMADKLHLG